MRTSGRKSLTSLTISSNSWRVHSLTLQLSITHRLDSSTALSLLREFQLPDPRVVAGGSMQMDRKWI